MNFDWASLLIGLVLPPLIGGLLALIKPESVAKLLTKLLMKVTKDSTTRNKIENIVGIKLMEIGWAIVMATPEDTELLNQIKELIEKLKEVEE